jgi:hypothetical protein
MKKQSKKPKYWAKKKIIAVMLAIILVLSGAVLGIQKARYYNDTANQANIVQIRELILLAVQGLKKNAPVEPHTGDIYFPESKLYLPNPNITLPLTYLDDKGDVTNSQGELSVSTFPVRGTEALYSASNVDELFKAVPKLQACSRGIKLVYEKFPQDDMQNLLKHTVHLENGRDLYVYLEKDCPVLSDTADLFQNIKSY